MRSSLREGEADIAITLHNVITNDATKSSIFALKGEEAEGFFILIHTVGLTAMEKAVGVAHNSSR